MVYDEVEWKMINIKKFCESEFNISLSDDVVEIMNEIYTAFEKFSKEYNIKHPGDIEMAYVASLMIKQAREK